MPDLYNGKSILRCIKSITTQLLARRGPFSHQIEAARTHLAQLPNCTGAAGIIGYCFGGAFVFLLAGRPGYSAAAIDDGQLPENPDEVPPLSATDGSAQRRSCRTLPPVRQLAEVFLGAGVKPEGLSALLVAATTNNDGSR